MRKYNMSDYIARVVPFSVERAKKIEKGEMAGVIRTRDGRAARIIAWDIEACKHIAAAIRDEGEEWGETIELYYDDGKLTDMATSDFDLVIELPTEYLRYDNFHPTKYQPCVVRDKDGWRVAVCMGFEDDHIGGLLPIWLSGTARIVTNSFEAVPLTRLTESLLGKKITYEDYVKQQTNEETD